MAAKLVTSLFALALVAGSLTAQPHPKPGEDKKLVTKVYNLKPLVGERGKASGVAHVDAVVKLIFETIPQLRELKPGADGPQIVERDGGRLEVRATAQRHGEIADLLAALERLQDVAVDVKADVIELDAAAYEKLVKALPKGKAKPPVLFAAGEEADEKPDLDAKLEAANKVLKAGRVVQTSTGRFVNGAEATISARRVVVPYATLPAAVAVGGRADGTQYVKEGFGLVALPVVSADRRFVRFKLTEQSTVITGMKKRELGEVGGKLIVAQSPVVEDLGATGSTIVADGGTAIFRLAYAPKDKVWVLVLRPTIFVQAEEDALKKP
jgi:hypothetical protein